jgi:hypothetical protein
MNEDPVEDDADADSEPAASTDSAPVCPPVEPSEEELAALAAEAEKARVAKAVATAFERKLSKLKTLSVTHNVRVYNKATGEVALEKNTRTFNVVSKDTYKGFADMIRKYKTHHPETGRCSWRDQASKIKLTNSLMKMCYKEPNQACFVYPVAIIYLKGDNTLTRNEVMPDSKCYFEVSDIAYVPQPETKHEVEASA